MSKITLCNKQEFVITPPESPPRINMDQPDFEKLTPAEKLNDRKYREQIYQVYPNEPTCFCVPANKHSAHPMVCRAGCTKSCCMNLRNPSVLEPKSVETTAISNGDYNPLVKEASNKTSQSTVRLRGGGSKDYLYHSNLDFTTTSEVQVKSIWQNNKINTRDLRLSGGAAQCCGMVGASGGGGGGGGTTMGTTMGVTTIFETPKLNKRQDPCSPRPGGGGHAPGCMCPSKEPATTRKGKGACTKKPCLGIDCLIQAFQEAQKFVDSLGKVPGLVGLGLMDPSESPYFGRDLDRDYPLHEAPIEKRKIQTGDKGISTIPVTRCNGPCAKPLGAMKSGHAFAPVYSTPASTPFTIAVPGRTGVVREAIPSLPDPSSVSVAIKPKKKEDKKEEKVEKKEPETASFSPADRETGPCGEPRCKSRRKRSYIDAAGFDSTESSPETDKTHMKLSHRSGAGRFSDKGKQRKGKTTISGAGPGGDHKSGTPSVKSHQIKVSKRIMRYVYTIGDVYPGINYGHKNCIDPRLRVPANMGWLWNTRATVGKLKPRIGWKPGAIARYLNELLKEAKAGSLEEDKDSRARSVPSRVRRGKMKSMSYSSVKKMQTKKEDEEEIELPPTLHIHRKDGVYYVTMYPIKQEQDPSNIPRLEEPTKPLQFKIVKNKDDASIASSSTASDMEIEFSPPAAINRYRKKPDLVHVDTQVKQQEILDAYKSGTKTDGVKKKEKKPKKDKKGKK